MLGDPYSPPPASNLPELIEKINGASSQKSLPDRPTIFLGLKFDLILISESDGARLEGLDSPDVVFVALEADGGDEHFAGRRLNRGFAGGGGQDHFAVVELSQIPEHRS